MLSRGLVALALLSSSVAAQQWPTTEWQQLETAKAVKNNQALQQLEEFAFPADIDESSKKGIRTNGLVIIKDGKLVYERYARGFEAQTPHLGWSMSKSVINALYGTAVLANKVDIADKITAKSPWLKGQGIEKVRYKDALEMSSGIRWQEGYEYAPVFSTVVAMLYTWGHQNMPEFVAGLGLEFEPGEHWEYSSGDTNLLSGALKDIVGEDNYADYPWTALFDPLGMNSSVWEKDASGHFVGSSYWYATPRDMAKFGYLYLNDGVWEDKRLLPKGWVDYSCRLNQGYKTTFAADPELGDRTYGAQFWLNVEDKSLGIEKAWPDAPTDVCAALGHWRQMIAVIPSENMVLVRVADDRSGDGAVTNNTVLKLAVEAFKESAGE